MPGVEVESNVGAYKAALRVAKRKALEAVGQAWRDDAKEQDTFRHWGEDLGLELKNSIDYVVDVDKGAVSVGSSMEIAAYAELGTGKEYKPPADYIENMVPKGTVVPAGIDHWIYFDPIAKEFRVGAPQPARPYLQKAYDENHDRYQAIIKGELSDVDINTR